MHAYRTFWDEIFYGRPYFGTSDVQAYWLRFFLVTVVFLLIGLASNRLRGLPVAVTALLLSMYAASIVPFMVWAASCSDCNGLFGSESPRSVEVIRINQVYGGLVGMAIGAVWIGATMVRIRGGAQR